MKNAMAYFALVLIFLSSCTTVTRKPAGVHFLNYQVASLPTSQHPVVDVELWYNNRPLMDYLVSVRARISSADDSRLARLRTDKTGVLSISLVDFYRGKSLPRGDAQIALTLTVDDLVPRWYGSINIPIEQVTSKIIVLQKGRYAIWPTADITAGRAKVLVSQGSLEAKIIDEADNLLHVCAGTSEGWIADTASKVAIYTIIDGGKICRRDDVKYKYRDDVKYK
ncbi:hypothetical protein FACS1894116_10490 [Betaproteobacteria bacterium]|nr:hypothetical protein FACS1894116_10490 [Betaproteobacteria bacterium]